jgi:hypothetical protein
MDNKWTMIYVVIKIMSMSTISIDRKERTNMKANKLFM